MSQYSSIAISILNWIPQEPFIIIMMMMTMMFFQSLYFIMMMLAHHFNGDNDDVDGDDDFKHLEQETCSHSATLPLTHCFEIHSTFTLQCNEILDADTLLHFYDTIQYQRSAMRG